MIKRASAHHVHAILLTAALAAANPLPAFANEAHRFDIEATDTGQAIQSFAAQSGVQILASVEQLKGAKLHEVNGTLSTDEALKALLKDTGLTHQYVGERTVAVVKESAVEGGGARGAPKSFWSRFRLADASGANESNVSASAAGSSGSVERMTLEEVVVSAQKKGDERLQDVPVPVTAVDARTLVNNGELRLRDFFSKVPGLSLSPETQGRYNVAIRGVTTGRATIPTVGMLVDDVPYGYSRGEGGMFPDIDPGDLQRVEVLRGPQGTLYGASSMGGLIKYVTRDPSIEGFSSSLTVGTQSVRNGDELGYNVRAAANLPLGETFAVRVSGFTREDPGYIDNPVLGIEGLNKADVSGGLLAALWRPSDELSVKLSALYQDTHVDGSSDVDLNPGLGDLQQNAVIGTGWNDRTIEAYSAVVDAQLGAVELTSITGYNINHLSDMTDSTAALGGLAPASYGTRLIQNYLDLESRRFSQELRLSIPLAERLDSVIGVFYTDDRLYLDQVVTAVTPAGAPVGVVLTTDDVLQSYEEYAAFANFTYRLSDRFDVQIGGRWGHNTVANERGSDGGAFNNNVDIPRPVVSFDDDVVTYLLTPRFKLSEDLMVYARFASGYRPGQPNPPLAVMNGKPAGYGSDTIRNYEVGLKGDFFDRVLSIDTSLYYIDWQDVQVRVNGFGTAYGINGGGAKSEGVELAFTVRPTAGLTVQGWVNYDDAVLTEAFPAGSPIIGVAGDRMPFSSRVSGNLSVEQRFPLPANMSGFVSAGIGYIGDRVSNFLAAGRVRQDFASYAKADVRAGLEVGSWSASLFVNNVADKRGVLNEDHYVPTRVTYIQPRTIGLNLTKSFE